MLILLILALVAGLIYKAYRTNRRNESGRSERSEPSEALKEQSRLFREEVEQLSHYYQLLEPDEKVLFLKRAWIFFKQKRFEARQIETVTFRMRTIIACYAAQVTFGLPDVRLKQFTTVIVYPQPYYSTINRQLHKGETNPAGAIIFSWKDLAEGHNRPTDGVNLALHELAHALRLENVTIEDNEFDFLDAAALKRFGELAEREMSRMRMFSNDHFLRAYGATNQQEFFAVCVESFFERPVPFSEKLPELYGTMTQILQQNPLVRPIRL